MAKLTPAEKQRRYREKRKLDEEREEAYKAKHQARNVKRKKVSELPDRQQRYQRKQWRKSDKIRRQKKKDLAAQDRASTPPPTPPLLGQEGNKKRGRKVLLKNRSKCVRQNKKLQEEVALLKSRLKLERAKSDCFRKRFERLENKRRILNIPSSELTPKSKAKKDILESFGKDLSENKKLMSSKVAHKLVFNNVLVSSIKSSYKREKSAKNKRLIGTVMMNKLIMRYRLQNKASKALGLRAKKRLIIKEVAKQNVLREKIRSFFLSEDVSCTTAGIKETITRNKVKQQKRYLNASMTELYKSFLQENGKIVSYTTFTRLRPFYVLKPSDVDRNTCLCKIHTNIQMKTSVLKQCNVIEENNPHVLTTLIACDKSSANCMYGTCINCKDKTVPANMENSDEIVSWHEWQIISQTKKKVVAGIEKLKEVKVSAKVKIDNSLEELMNKFQKDMRKFKMHVFNIKKQNEAYKLARENLNKNEAVIHIDFSENYACKYASEIQSFHFGSSRNQASLHTGVVYLPNTQNPICFASVSSCLSHEPPAIWAHLKPLLLFLRQDYSIVKTLHFFSDGPASQYRQKKNFYLFSHMIYDMGFNNATWSFFEASHGKGAPDGVGGALKRIANSYVAHGNDLKDAESLFELLSNNSSVKTFYVNEKDVNDIALLLPKTVPAVKGTLMIHQIHTCQKGKISYREVSCFCKNNIWDTGKLCNCQFAQKYFSFLTDMPTSSTSKNCHGQKHVSKKKKCVYQNIYSSSNSSDSESFTSDCHVEFQESDEETFQTMTDRIEQEEMQDEEEVRAAQVGAWVLVQFTSKKSSTKHFVVQIIELNHENDDYVVKFVRKSGNFFQWPEMEDLSVVTRDDIVIVLPEPMPARRGDKVSFKLKFDGYNIN